MKNSGEFTRGEQSSPAVSQPLLPSTPATTALLYENPYVGPRTFVQEEGDRFFGREREARDLLLLVVSERLVLFYAQSGAGKSSLINTRMIPGLRAKGFEILPIGRVSGSGDLQRGVNIGNIFIYNLMLSLDKSNQNPNRFTTMVLKDFLAGLNSSDGTNYLYEDFDEAADSENYGADYETWPRVLIIDQFEEILTTNLQAWEKRTDFFRQLSEAMTDDPYLWVVLTMREDYVAALDPYVDLLPGKLRIRFYMQCMEYNAALEAIEKPAERGGRPFAAGVAETLVDNLRKIRVHGQTETQPGQFIEPVQLQVVCYQLWENLSNRLPGEIKQEDLPIGYVDQALTQFYEAAVRKVVDLTGETEGFVRDWFEKVLITESLTRSIVYRGDAKTGGLANEAIDLLVGQFLLRPEVRAGSTWYELIHDRFVEPILKSNHAWYSQHLQTAQKRKIRTQKKQTNSLLWDTVKYINQDKFTPIISDFISRNYVFPSPGGLAKVWAEFIDCPTLFEHDLAHLAQFYSIHKNSARLKEDYLNFIKDYLLYLVEHYETVAPSLLETVEEISHELTLADVTYRLGYPHFEKVLKDPLAILADLPLSIYLTTSYYDFLEVALRRSGKTPQSEICCWHNDLKDIPSIFSEEPGFEPDISRPLVYHFYGRDQYPNSLVLSEADYLDFIVHIRTYSHEVFPSPVISALQNNSLFLLGYERQSWEFRGLFEGVLAVSHRNGPTGVIDQTLPPQSGDGKESFRYLEQHFAQAGFKVYWGMAQDFMNAMWQEYRGQINLSNTLQL